MGGGVIVGSTHYFKTQIRPLNMAHVTLETLVITKQYNTLIYICTKDNKYDIYHVNN